MEVAARVVADAPRDGDAVTSGGLPGRAAAQRAVLEVELLHGVRVDRRVGALAFVQAVAYGVLLLHAHVEMQVAQHVGDGLGGSAGAAACAGRGSCGEAGCSRGEPNAGERQATPVVRVDRVVVEVPRAAGEPPLGRGRALAKASHLEETPLRDGVRLVAGGVHVPQHGPPRLAKPVPGDALPPELGLQRGQVLGHAAHGGAHPPVAQLVLVERQGVADRRSARRWNGAGQPVRVTGGELPRRGGVGGAARHGVRPLPRVVSPSEEFGVESHAAAVEDLALAACGQSSVQLEALVAAHAGQSLLLDVRWRAERQVPRVEGRARCLGLAAQAEPAVVSRTFRRERQGACRRAQVGSPLAQCHHGNARGVFGVK